MSDQRLVLFVSDHTGITVESMGLALLSQFPEHDFRYEVVPFVDTVDKARQVADRIARVAGHGGNRPVVFSSLVAPRLRAVISAAPALCVDFFDSFEPPLEREFGQAASHIQRRAHGVTNGDTYLQRMEAVNFSLAHDDGIGTPGYQHADVILVGVSRCGKTPTCLYLALNCGIKAANYPLTEEDADVVGRGDLPPALEPVRDKLYGLSIDPVRLHEIRDKRRPGSDYASPMRCRREVAAAEGLYERFGVPYSTTTGVSVEEVATAIRQHLIKT